MELYEKPKNLHRRDETYFIFPIFPLLLLLVVVVAVAVVVFVPAVEIIMK